MAKISSVDVGKFKLPPGKKSAAFLEAFDQIPITTIANACGITNYKQTSTGKLTFSCVYHDDGSSSACILPPKNGAGTYHCSVCGSLTLFEFYCDRSSANSGAQGTSFAVIDFGISDKLEVNMIVDKDLSKKSKKKTNKSGNSSFKDPVLSEEMVDSMNEDLLGNEEMLTFIKNEKGFSLDVIKEFKIGRFDRGSGDVRYIIPIRDTSGKLINYRMYNPKKKLKWIGLTGVNIESLFPHEVDETAGPVLIVEGEGCCLAGRSVGLNTYTGTAGSGTWHSKWSEKFADMDVSFMYDNDQPGYSGAIKAAENMVNYAATCKVIKALSKKTKGDLVNFLVEEKGTKKDVLKAIEFADNFESNAGLLTSSSEMDFDELVSLMPQKRVTTRFKVYQIKSDKILLPSMVQIECDNGSKKACNSCQANCDDKKFDIECIPANIDYMMTHQIQTDRSHLASLIRVNCNKIVPYFDDKYNMYFCDIYDVGHPYEGSSNIIKDCIIITEESIEIVRAAMFESQMEVGTFPKNKSGKGLKRKAYFAFQPIRIKTEEEKFKVEKEYNELSVFQPKNNESAKEKLDDIYKEIEGDIGIFERQDSIRAVDLCFLSVKEIMVKTGKKTYEVIKGTMEVAIFGDSRTGKTKIAERLSNNLYKYGKLYDCANLSNAALIGMATGRAEGFSPGILPRSDGELIILDEADKYPETTKFEKLTAARSSGIVRYSKLDQSVELPAKVRMVWIANPPSGERMSQYAHNFEVFRHVMKHSASIARFDFAIPVVSKEFDDSVIDFDEESKYSEDAQRKLSIFSRSLKSNDVKFEKFSSIKKTIKKYVKIMFEMFGRDNGPISNDIENKILRVGTAIAVRLFSYDRELGKLVVTEEHIEVACNYLIDFHSRDDVGYDVLYSTEHNLETTIRDFDYAFEAFSVIKRDDQVKLFCSSIVENIGMNKFMIEDLVGLMPANQQASLDMKQKFLRSGVIFRVNDINPRITRTKYRFSKEGYSMVSIIAEHGGTDRNKVLSLLDPDYDKEQVKIVFSN